MRRLLVPLLAAAIALSGVPASAHRQVIQSPENPDAKRVDIESVEVTHPRGNVRFVITFREPHPMNEEELDPFLRIEFRTKRKSPQRFRNVVLHRNPDGSLVGHVRTALGKVRGFANIYIPDERSVVVELHRQQLRAFTRARVMDWVLGMSYRDEDCETGDVVGFCTDTVTRSGNYFFHRFER